MNPSLKIKMPAGHSGYRGRRIATAKFQASKDYTVKPYIKN